MVFFLIPPLKIDSKTYLSANSVYSNILKYRSIQSIICTAKIEYFLEDRNPPPLRPLASPLKNLLKVLSKQRFVLT